MGWSSGSKLFADLADVIAAYVRDEDDRKQVYTDMIHLFEDHDCDTLHECTGIDHILDETLAEFYEEDKDIEDDDEWPDGGREDF